jgi:predicted nucleic acid-binding Zn ribbon protein
MLPLNATAPRAVAELIKRTPLTPGKIEFVWRAAVGPAIARVTHVTLDTHGVLVVRTPDRHWAGEIRRSAVFITTRINALLGETVIKDIRTHHA